MPKLKRWLKAKKNVQVFSRELLNELTRLNVSLAGSDHEISQTIHVNSKNREAVIELLEKNGYEVEDIEQDPVSP